MVEDLGMSGIQYNIALSLFFIPYILLEGKIHLRNHQKQFRTPADCATLC